MAKDKRFEARQDGFIFAYIFLQSHTLHELEMEIENREKTMVYTNHSQETIFASPGHRQMKDFVYQGQDLMFCTVLRTMGFGKKRIERNLKFILDRRRNNFLGACNRLIENSPKLQKIMKNDPHDVTRCDYKNLKMDKKVKEYVDSRNAGIVRAIQIVKEEGLKELRKQIYRKSCDTKMNALEEAHATEIARAHFNEAAITDWLLSLHEHEGFGDKRLNDVMDDFEKMYSAVIEGLVGFENYVFMVEECGVELNVSELKTSPNYPMRGWGKVLEDLGVLPEEVEEVIEEENVSEPVEEAIVEPDDYTSYPCIKCQSSKLCKEQRYKTECTCFALYKEVRRENVVKNIKAS